jgi:rubrerythrin
MDPLSSLIAILQLAYSGERAAARAYQGHARSVRAVEEKQRIGEIERDEWVHRKRVGEMLAELGAAPRSGRDRWMGLVGALIAFLCHLGGWWIPMYGAGKIERRNIVEYEDAARLAWQCGRSAFADELLAMAELEWDHEKYFHDLVRGHWLHRLVGSWPAPPPRSQIRAAFTAFTAEHQRLSA